MDSLWYQDIDEDTLFTQAFIKTGNRIMQHRLETKDLVWYGLTIFAILSVVAGILCFAAIMVIKRSQDMAEAE